MSSIKFNRRKLNRLPLNAGNLGIIDAKKRFKLLRACRAANADWNRKIWKMESILLKKASRNGRRKLLLTGSEWVQVQVVHLPNDLSRGLGFGIVGGTSTGVVIKTILPGSVTDKDGRLAVGDRILMVGGISTQAMSSQQVASLLRQCAPVVELAVARPTLKSGEHDSPTSWIMPTRAILLPDILKAEIQIRLARIGTEVAEEGENANPTAGLPKISNHVALQDYDQEGGHFDEHDGTSNAISSKLEPVELFNDEFGGKYAITTDREDNVRVFCAEVIEHDNELEPFAMLNNTEENLNPSTRRKRIQKAPDQEDKDAITSTSADHQQLSKMIPDMVPTSFERPDWVPGKYIEIDVELERDPHFGLLGITVAGYIYKKEEINGVFIKSIVPYSSAHIGNVVRLHDLIIEVNGRSLETLNHADSVRMLIRSGNKVRLKMIRFDEDSPQAGYLKMLHEQELSMNNEGRPNSQDGFIDYKSYWMNKLGDDFEVHAVDIRPDRNQVDMGLGISLEGTVDIVEGTGSMLFSHHFIESIRSDGPAAKLRVLRAGDELLQVNGTPLYGETHVTVTQSLSRAAKHGNENHPVRYIPSNGQALPLAYHFLATMMTQNDHLIKAKSELVLHPNNFIKSGRIQKSRSLEHLTGLAIWNCVPIVVTLEKDSKGLGFSVYDYQDPMHPSETAIVVRSLVPGGVAQADGRIVPGDRLLFVNNEDVSNCSLDKAVSVLKSAHSGPVKLGIAKPIPIADCKLGDYSPLISKSERILAKRSRRKSTTRCSLLSPPLSIYSKTSTPLTSEEELMLNCLNTNSKITSQLYFPGSETGSPATPRSQFSQATTMHTWSPCSSRSLSPCTSPCGSSLRDSWAFDVVHLPPSLERHIKISKGPFALGLVIDANVDKAINGCVVKNICSKKAVARDGRIQAGDFIVKCNNESLRNVTTAKARAILKRANLLGTQCNMSYITLADALLWKQRYNQIQSAPEYRPSGENTISQNRLSPKVFPKFYRPIFRDFESSGEDDLDHFSGGLHDADTSQHGAEYAKKLDEYIELVIKSAFSDAFVEIAPHKWQVTKSNKSKRASVDFHNHVHHIFENVLRPRALSLAITPENPLQMNFPRMRISPRLRHLPPLDQKISSIPEFKSSLIKHPQTITFNVDSSSSLKTIISQSDSEVDPTVISEAMWSEPRTVTLTRNPDETFGISIVGGRVEVAPKMGKEALAKSLVSGIFIKSVLKNSPAGLSGLVFMGDRILSVNDVDLIDVTHDFAVNIIKSAKNPVNFILQSLQGFIPKENIGEQTEPSSATTILSIKNHVSSHGKLDGINEPSSTALNERNRLECTEQDSAAALKKSLVDDEDEDCFFYTKMKIQQKYNHLPGEPILIRLENVPPGGLGLSLAAEPIEEGNTDIKSMVIVDIKSSSQAHLKVGDEILEINSKVLTGLSHVAAFEKIYSCKDDRELALVILRKKQSITTPPDISTSCQQNGDDLSRSFAVVSEKDEQDIEIKPSAEADVQKELTDHRKTRDEHGSIELQQTAAADEQEASPSKTGQQQDVNSSGRHASMSGPEGPKHSTSSLLSSTTGDGRKRSWQMDVLQKVPIECGKETLIEIDKDGKGLGLSIVGGSDTVLGTVVIHEVYSDGAAAIDGRLKPGDQLLEVNSVSLRAVCHEAAISTLRRTPAKVRILIYRDENLLLSLLDPTQIYNTLEIELVKKPGRGLGISIVGRTNEPGVYISEIVRGGVAEFDGRLMHGDQILSVNEVNVTKSMQEDVATLMKTISGKVSLKIGRWKLMETAHRIRMAHPPTSTHSTNNGGMLNQQEFPLQQQQNRIENDLMDTSSSSSTMVPSSSADAGPQPAGSSHTPHSFSSHNPTTNGTVSTKPPPPPPAPYPSSSSGRTMQAPSLQIMIHDENNQQIRSDLSPVSEEDLKSVAEVGTSESTSATRSTKSTKTISFMTTPVRNTTRPDATTLRMDLYEADCEPLLILLKKEDGQQWGMGIGKRPRGILITSLQPGSSADEKLKIGDRILAVNGTEVTDQHSAVSLVKASENMVALQVARPKPQKENPPTGKT